MSRFSFAWTIISLNPQALWLLKVERSLSGMALERDSAIQRCKATSLFHAKPNRISSAITCVGTAPSKSWHHHFVYKGVGIIIIQVYIFFYIIHIVGSVCIVNNASL